MKTRSCFAWFCATAFILSGYLAASAHASTAQVLTRAEQKIEDTWDLTRMYSGAAEWREAFSTESAIDYDACLAPYRSAPKLTSQALRELFDLYYERDRAIDKLYCWAYLSHIQNVTNGDMKLPQVEDGKGEFHAPSTALFGQYMSSPDRVLRKNAFKAIYGIHKQYEHTLAQLLQGKMQQHVFAARARNYSSCLEAALFPKNIPTAIYRNLIRTVRSHVDTLHRYVHLIKQYRQVDDLRLYDLQPIADEDMGSYSYDEAVALIVEACRPLGPEYVEQLKNGLTVDRWVDRYENLHKKSGASSNGCYDSPPYILISFAGSLWDTFLLAHESGHSMESELSRFLPYHYSTLASWQSGGFSLEVPSTFREHLLSHYLLCQARSDPTRELKLLDSKLNNMVMYIYLQTLFAEYDLFIHECVEQGIALTPEMLSQKWTELYATYYGTGLLTNR